MNDAAGRDLEIGLQLWTLRDLVASDLPAALAATRDAGFRTVEDEDASDPVAAARASNDGLRRLIGQPSPIPAN